jgi:hypothetical protein
VASLARQNLDTGDSERRTEETEPVAHFVEQDVDVLLNSLLGPPSGLIAIVGVSLDNQFRQKGLVRASIECRQNSQWNRGIRISFAKPLANPVRLDVPKRCSLGGVMSG